MNNNNYFRITAYNEKEDLSVIMDSYGMFEKLWQFSSFLIQKGFKIIQVSNSDNFLDGNITKIDYDQKHILLRASKQGRPIDTTYVHNNIEYPAIKGMFLILI